MTLNRSNAGPNGPAPAVAAAPSTTRVAGGTVQRLLKRCALVVLAVAAWHAVPSAMAQNTSAQSLNAQDLGLLTGLQANGYSADEIGQLRQLLDNARHYAQEMGLAEPPSQVELLGVSENVADRLAVIGPEFAQLASLPGKSIEQATGVTAISPANVAQVIAMVYTLVPDEKAAMFGGDAAKLGAAERSRNRQKNGWLERNLARLSAADLAKACTLANTLLQNAAHLSTEVARLMLATALELHAPVPDYGVTPTDAQKIMLGNRPLNMAQSLAWMTALAKPGVAYRAGNGEFIKVTQDKVAYVITPGSKNRSIAGLPTDLQDVAVRGLARLQALQNGTMSHGREMAQLNTEIAQTKAEIVQIDASIAQKDASIAQNKEVIAQNKAEIAQSKAEIAQSKAVIAQKTQHSLIIRTTDVIREKILPLLAAYLGANAKKQEDIRSALRLLARQLREAEQFTRKIEPLTEENRIEKETSLRIIKEMEDLIAKTGVDPSR